MAGILEEYNRRHDLDLALMDHFTGVEILRRIIGLAQLPLEMSLEDRSMLLEEAYGLLM